MISFGFSRRSSSSFSATNGMFTESVIGTSLTPDMTCLSICAARVPPETAPMMICRTDWATTFTSGEFRTAAGG
jgi:hypothetical protein